jgi:hypothetical protein
LPASTSALRADLALVAFGTPGRLPDDATWLEQRKRAEEIGYAPVVRLIDLAGASFKQVRGDRGPARREFEEVALAAEAAGDTFIRADARLSIASIDIEEKRPAAAVEASIRAARTAITAAGSPVVMSRKLEELEAVAAYERGDRERAIEIFSRILPVYAERRATRRAQRVAAVLAELLHERDGPGDRERAQETLRVEIERERAELGKRAIFAADLEALRQQLARPAAGRRATE